MRGLDKMVGKIMLHKELGRVEIISRVPRSITKLNVRVVQRAKGWNEQTARYEPVQTVRPNLNEKGEEIGKSIQYKIYSDKHSQYGHEDVVHVNELTKIEKI